MTAEKKTTKKTVKKASVKKISAPRKTSVKTPAAKKETLSEERFYAMVSEAAYFAAQNDGNRKGATDYWIEAEAAIRSKFNVA